MALVGSRYIQDADPGAVGFGYEWAKSSTGELFVRNTGNTAWVLIGNLNNPNLGMLPLSGGAMTGAVAGSSGLAPLDSPDFQTTAKRGGVNLARMTDLNTLAATLRGEMSNIANSIVSASLPSSLTKGNIAANHGTQSWTGLATQSLTLPLPQYPDGTTALATEVLLHGAYISQATFSDSTSTAGTVDMIAALTDWSARTYSVTAFHQNLVGNATITVSWFVIAVR